MVRAVEAVQERLLELEQFLDGKVAFAELAFHEPALDGLVDHLLEVFGRGVRHGAAGGLDDVGEHEDGGFLALRLRALVAEILFLDDLVGVRGLFERLVVEVLDDGRTVVLGDARGDEIGYLVLLREDGAVLHVSRDDLDGLVGVERVVRVHALLLVLGEVFGAHRLAEVVVERHDADEERVGSDAVCNLLGEVRYLDAVVEGARGELRDALECRPVEVGHFHEREYGRDAVDALDQVHEQHGGDCRTGDDVYACGDERLVERGEFHAVTQQEHDRDGDGQRTDAGEDAPQELYAVAHAGQRLCRGEEHYDDGDGRCEVVSVENAERECGEYAEACAQAPVVEHGRDDRREGERVQPHEVHFFGEGGEFRCLAQEVG